jgi:hypothetical protein
MNSKAMGSLLAAALPFQKLSVRWGSPVGRPRSICFKDSAAVPDPGGVPNPDWISTPM